MCDGNEEEGAAESVDHIHAHQPATEHVVQRVREAELDAAEGRLHVRVIAAAEQGGGGARSAGSLALDT